MEVITMLRHIKNIFTFSILFFSTYTIAADIVVGPGKGIIWSGFPFNVTYSRKDVTDKPGTKYRKIGIDTEDWQYICMPTPQIERTVDGYLGYKIAKGLYFIPRATVSGQYPYKIGSSGSSTAALETVEGTLGYPDTKLTGAKPSNPNTWCYGGGYDYSSIKYENKMAISGDWIIWADGTQAPSATIFKIPKFVVSALIKSQVVTAPLTVQVVGVQCSVNVQNNVDLGYSEYNSTPNAELASAISPFFVSCKQGSVPTTANINASFRANTSIFNTDNTQLALTQGGGYITGEISNGVTGTGACSSHPSSINFSQTPIKLMTLPASAPSIDFNSTITWRLCSGGAQLPVGNISSSAELSIVFS
jgi:hypothetical protein